MTKFGKTYKEFGSKTPCPGLLIANQTLKMGKRLNKTSESKFENDQNHHSNKLML